MARTARSRAPVSVGAAAGDAALLEEVGAAGAGASLRWVAHETVPTAQRVRRASVPCFMGREANRNPPERRKQTRSAPSPHQEQTAPFADGLVHDAIVL